MPPITGKPSPEVLEYLQARRSAKVDDLAAPGPSPKELETILKCAMRTPDHGKMFPWYFIVFEGQGREAAGDILADAYRKANPDAREDKVEVERRRLMRAPVVVAVVSRIRKGKNPVWEQVMSAGAVCLNLSLAAHASGYGVSWLTEWFAYDEHVKSGLGLDARDHIAGFLYIGTYAGTAEERDRPDMNLLVNHFTPGRPLEKGDAYDQVKFDFPKAGFDFSF